jgi:hypothetical protein
MVWKARGDEVIKGYEMGLKERDLGGALLQAPTAASG